MACATENEVMTSFVTRTDTGQELLLANSDDLKLVTASVAWMHKHWNGPVRLIPVRLTRSHADAYGLSFDSHPQPLFCYSVSHASRVITPRGRIILYRVIAALLALITVLLLLLWKMT